MKKMIFATMMLVFCLNFLNCAQTKSMQRDWISQPENAEKYGKTLDIDWLYDFPFSTIDDIRIVRDSDGFASLFVNQTKNKSAEPVKRSIEVAFVEGTCFFINESKITGILRMVEVGADKVSGDGYRREFIEGKTYVCIPMYYGSTPIVFTNEKATK